MNNNVPSVTQSNILQTVGEFVAGILPAAVEVVQGLDNRVPEPSVPDFVVMWEITRKRLAENMADHADVAFVGSTSGNTLTVTQILEGVIAVGQQLYGIGLAVGTTITALGTGTGGLGTYSINISQTVASEIIQAGQRLITYKMDVQLQLDIHGPNSADNSQTMVTLFRDRYAFEFFQNSGYAVQVLHCDDPRQMPFLDAEQQTEKRWMINMNVQVDSVVATAEQFTSGVTVGITDVDVTYPS